MRLAFGTGKNLGMRLAVCLLALLLLGPQALAAPQQPTPPSAPARDFVFCTQCGSKNPVNSRFCSECGSPIIRIQA